MAACRSWAVDDAANPSDDSKPAADRGGPREAYRPDVPKASVSIKDGSVDLMKSRSLGGVDGLGGAWKMPLTDETFDARPMVSPPA